MKIVLPLGRKYWTHLDNDDSRLFMVLFWPIVESTDLARHERAGKVLRRRLRRENARRHVRRLLHHCHAILHAPTEQKLLRVKVSFGHTPRQTYVYVSCVRPKCLAGPKSASTSLWKPHITMTHLHFSTLKFKFKNYNDNY